MPALAHQHHQEETWAHLGVPAPMETAMSIQNLDAEDLNYWKTGKSSPDTWVGRAKRQIEDLGGIVVAEAFGNEPLTGRSAYMLSFVFGEDRFKIAWPVLHSRTGNESAARIQAATFLYHTVKALCLSATVLGPRAAFFSFLILPSGQTAAYAAVPELVSAMPRLLSGA